MTSLTIVRRIKARPSVVFDAISTPAGIMSWWGPDPGPVLIAETDVRVGGRYRVRFRMLNGSEHETVGMYQVVEKPWRLAMTWQWIEGGGGPGESRLEFVLREIPEGTELTLTHDKLRDAESAKGHESGWNGALDKLERFFEGGSDVHT